MPTPNGSRSRLAGRGPNRLDLHAIWAATALAAFLAGAGRLFLLAAVTAAGSGVLVWWSRR